MALAAASTPLAVASGPLAVSPWGDPGSVSEARHRAETIHRPPPGSAVVVPHDWGHGHLLVAGVRAVRGLDRVVVLGPDHRNIARTPAATTSRGWRTPSGVVRVDTASTAHLLDDGDGLLSDVHALGDEHSLAAVASALAAEAPGVPVVPIALRSNLTANEVRAVTARLARLTASPGTGLVASVDFAHAPGPGAARAADAESRRVLVAGDGWPFFRWGPEHSDGRTVLPVFFDLAQARGQTDCHLLAHASSELLGGPFTAVTSTFLVACGSQSGRYAVAGARAWPR